MAYLSPASALARVLTGVPQIVGGGRFFDKAGNRVPQPGAAFDSSGVRQAVRAAAYSVLTEAPLDLPEARLGLCGLYKQPLTALAPGSLC